MLTKIDSNSIYFTSISKTSQRSLILLWKCPWLYLRPRYQTDGPECARRRRLTDASTFHSFFFPTLTISCTPLLPPQRSTPFVFVFSSRHQLCPRAVMLVPLQEKAVPIVLFGSEIQFKEQTEASAVESSTSPPGCLRSSNIILPRTEDQSSR